MDPSAIKTLISTIEQFNGTQYVRVVLMALYTADFFHTLFDEIKFIWFTPWTLFKVVFFYCRYSPFIDTVTAIIVIAARNPPVKACEQLVRINIWCAGLGSVSSHVILIVRAYALLGPSRRNAIFFTIFGTATFATAITFMAGVDHSTSVTLSPFPGFIPGCIMSSSSSSSITNVYAILGIIVSVVDETVLFIIVCLVRFRKYGGERNRLISKIYRDAFIYYLISFGISISGIIVWFTASGPILDLSARAPRYLLSIVACRVVLHIRKYGHENYHSGDTTNALPTTGFNETNEISGLQFRVTARSENTLIR